MPKASLAWQQDVVAVGVTSYLAQINEDPLLGTDMRNLRY